MTRAEYQLAIHEKYLEHGKGDIGQKMEVYDALIHTGMKHKSCFTNAHCCFECPNAAADEFEEIYDIPASDAGYERIESCKVCYLNTGDCEDCLFQNSKDCPEVEHDKR